MPRTSHLTEVSLRILVAWSQYQDPDVADIDQLRSAYAEYADLPVDDLAVAVINHEKERKSGRKYRPDKRCACSPPNPNTKSRKQWRLGEGESRPTVKRADLG